MSIKLKGKSTRQEAYEFTFSPIGSVETAWIITEELRRDYLMDACHDGGLEKEAEHLYLSSSEEGARGVFDRLIDARKKQGWKIKPEFFHRNILAADLTKQVGDDRYELRYFCTTRGIPLVRS